MTTASPTKPSEPKPADTPEPHSVSNDPVYTAKLSARWALRPVHLLVVVFWCGLFLLFNYLPLHSPAFWHQLNTGRWILAHGRLPEPADLLPLAEGMQVTQTGWLAQVAFAHLWASAGAMWLSNAYAAIMIASLLLLARVFYLQTRSPAVATLGVALFALVGWSRLTVPGAEALAVLCAAGLLWALANVWATPEAGGESRRRTPLAVTAALVFALQAAWTNVHASFTVGLAILVCALLGRALETAWQSRSLRAVLLDKEAGSRLILLEAGLLAMLVNPHGIDLLISRLRDSGQPLSFIGVGGREFILSWVLLLVVLRHSPRRVTAVESLLLILFSAAALYQQEMIAWYGMIYALVVAPHIASIALLIIPENWRREEQPQVRPINEEPLLPKGRSWKYSLICALLLWVTFCFSGWRHLVFQGAVRRTDEQLYGAAIPWGVSEYLRENPRPGLILCSVAWSDWLSWAGGDSFTPMLDSDLHMVPPRVSRDYQRFMAGSPGWQGVPDRYRVYTLVLDREEQPSGVLTNLRRSGEWTVLFDDDEAMVLARNRPEVPAYVRPAGAGDADSGDSVAGAGSSSAGEFEPSTDAPEPDLGPGPPEP